MRVQKGVIIDRGHLSKLRPSNSKSFSRSLSDVITFMNSFTFIIRYGAYLVAFFSRYHRDKQGDGKDNELPDEHGCFYPIVLTINMRA